MDKKLIMLISVMILAVVLWGVLLFLPKSSQLHELNNKLEKLEVKEEKKVSPADVNIVKTRIDSLQKQIDSLEENIYSGRQLLDMGRKLEKIGSEYDLELVTVSPDFESLSIFNNNEGLSQLPVIITFKGRFSDFSGLLDDINNMPFTIRLTGIRVIRNDPSKRNIEFNIYTDIVIENNFGETETDNLSETSKENQGAVS